MSFYQRARTSDPHKVHVKLATLPFHCIVTSSHDESMSRALASVEGKAPRTAGYQFKGFQEQLADAGTPASPLVYHLFGRTETPRSLVLTEQDLVDFLVAVVAKTPPIPEALLSELRNPDKMFLFLGFGVRNWYPRVLLHVLKKESGNSRSFALEEFPSAAGLDRRVFFYRHGYKVEVFNTDVAVFVDELCTHSRTLAPSGGSRPAAAPAATGGARPSAFLCHVHENAALARSLAKSLGDQGIDVWLDERNLEPGARWDDEIVKRIGQVDYFVILITRELVGQDKSYAFKELKLALEQADMFPVSRRFIMPLLIDGAPMLEELAHLHQGPVRGGERDDPLTATSAAIGEVVARLASSIKRDQQLRLKKGA